MLHSKFCDTDGLLRDCLAAVTDSLDSTDCCTGLVVSLASSFSLSLPVEAHTLASSTALPTTCPSLAGEDREKLIFVNQK